MSVGISLEELLAWNEQSAAYWKTHLETNPALLELPCDIGGTANVQGFVRHIWGAELRWSQRLAGLPVADREKLPAGPLDALFDLASPGRRNLPQPARRGGCKPGASPTFSISIGCLRSRGPSRGERSPCPCPIPQPASLGATCDSGPQPPASPPGSVATCCSVLHCGRLPLRWALVQGADSPVASESTTGTAPGGPASA
jgi:hypothetical protein